MAAIAASIIGRRHLLVFLDYLYSAIIALSLAEAFSKIVAPFLTSFETSALAGRGWGVIAAAAAKRIATPDVTNHLVAALLFIATFWFVVDDWLDTRGLTEIHEYRSFRRFFIDVLTAFFSYAALIYATRRSILMLAFIFLIHALSVWWSRRLLIEHPDSAERQYVSFYRFGCGFGALTAFVILAIYLWRYGTEEIGATSAVILSAIGLLWLATFDLSEVLWGRRGQPPWDPPTPIFSAQRLQSSLLRFGTFLDKVARKIIQKAQ
jgi:hypothetical protein